MLHKALDPTKNTYFILITIVNEICDGNILHL